MNLNSEKIKKILVFRLCCLGDVMQVTPVISALKKNFPDAEISFAASSWVTKLSPYLKHIDDIIIYNAPFQKNIFKKISGTLKFILALRKRKFDLVFSGHRNNIYGLLLKFSGIRFRLGFSETNYMTHTSEFSHNEHIVLRYLRILKDAGLQIENANVELKQIRPHEEIRKENKIGDGKYVIGIFPFGGSNPGTEMDIKRWDLDKYINLALMISERYPNLKIILFEGSLNSEKIKQQVLNPNILKLTISIDLMTICNIFITNDTGPLYIAQGFNIPTLSIFGPSDPSINAPQSTSDTIHKYIWRKPECSPCYTTQTAYETSNQKYWRGNSFVCHTGTHTCVKSITVEEIFTAFEKMIQELLVVK